MSSYLQDPACFRAFSLTAQHTATHHTVWNIILQQKQSTWSSLFLQFLVNLRLKSTSWTQSGLYYRRTLFLGSLTGVVNARIHVQWMSRNVQHLWHYYTVSCKCRNLFHVSILLYCSTVFCSIAILETPSWGWHFFKTENVYRLWSSGNHHSCYRKKRL